jgi:enoyl-CoA hydratase/carnithine racemase
MIDTDLAPNGVATVTLMRAAKLNTLNTAAMEALVAALEALGRDAGVRAVVLRGEGERAFIGGADITEMAALDPATARTFITNVHRCCAAIRALPVPVVARLAGYTLGAGLEVAAACDMRIAATDAVFGMPEVRIGIPSVVEAALLPGLIGWGRTRLLLLTGDRVDAATALAWGLVEETAPAAGLDAAIRARTESIVASGPRAVRLQKALIRDWEGLSPEAAISRGVDAFVDAFATDEPARMMGAFLDEMRRRRG